MAESKDVVLHTAATPAELDPTVESLDVVISDEPLTLVSADGRRFEVNRKYACVSKLVCQAIENDSKATEVPIPGAKGVVLAMIVEYMNEHKGTEPAIIEKPLRSKLMKDCVKTAWDAPFIDGIGENRQALYDLILAANYMDVKSLLHLGCAKVASLIKGQPLEKIKDILAVDQTANKRAAEKSTESKV